MTTTPASYHGDPTAGFPTKHLPPVEVRELPEPPERWSQLIGPGVIAAGVGIASGEFLLYPYIASQVGLVFIWAALVGLITQFFINMEIERYTLATGETVLTGFSRYWRHWGLVFALLTYGANLWPAWATGSATLVTYLFDGGSANWIAAAMLVTVALILTLAPVVYVALERTQMLKVAAVLILFVVAGIFAIGASAWADLPDGITGVTEAGSVIDELGFALVLGALAFAGGGGGQNLCQSNWIRDKRFGMGAHAARLTSPVTGEEEAAPGTGVVFQPDATNMARWQRWWRFANLEQASTFVLITFVSIVFTSLLAYATVFGRSDLPEGDIGFLRIEGNVLADEVGTWFQGLFWTIGAFSLFAAAVGIVDYTSRLGADVLKTSYLSRSDVSESKVYFALVWGLVVLGLLVLTLGFDQPLVLAVIAASVGGFMMFLYSALLILINRRSLPAPLRIGVGRTIALLWSFVLFGVLAGLTFYEQIPTLWD